MINSHLAIILFLTTLLLYITVTHIQKLFSLFRILAYYLPFNFLRLFFFRCGRVNIGKNVFISSNVSIMDRVAIGDNSFLDKQAILGKNVSIGNSVIISRNAYISNCKIGNHCKINTGAVVFGTDSNSLIIGNKCTIGYYSVLDGSGGLKIGNSVHIASPSVGIWTHSSIGNALNGVKINTPEYEDNKVLASVVIGPNTWIGGNTTIMPGVAIEERVIILPNSVVNKDLQKDKMYGGTPVKETEYMRFRSWE